MLMSWIIAVVVCFASVLVLRPLAVNWGLVDSPNKRKRHFGNIPLIGGIAIYLATLSGVSFYLENSQHINLILVSVSLMVFIGALDDKYDLNAKLRLIAQVLIASILTFGTDIHIHTFGNLFGTGDIVTGPLSGLVTILALVAGINAFNMSDGIDGLAGMLSLIGLTASGFLLVDDGLKVLVGALVASIVVFLFFNLGLLTKKYKVFMGDAGSMMLGLIVSWLLITISQSDSGSIKPANVLWFIAVPLIDMLTVMYRRVRKGQSPLVADREHLHHVFMDIGLNSKQALLFITIIGLIFMSIGFALEYYNFSERTSILLFTLSFLIYNKMLNQRHKLKQLLRRNS